MNKGNIKVLALIGARSGSKGVVHKNIRPLGGRPLMGWIIGAAQEATHVDRVVVSTDLQEYADVARTCGAEVPFLRPSEISQDSSTDIEYITHALDWLEQNEGYVPDIVLRLVATAPLQSAEDIDACVEELLRDSDAHAAMVVAEARQHPAKALRMVDDGKGGAHLVTYGAGSSRDATPLGREKYEKAYLRANVIATRTSVIRRSNSLTGERVRAHVIGQERAIDIDSEIDFLTAEMLLHDKRKEI